MQPDDMPDNVVPLRPRTTDKARGAHPANPAPQLSSTHQVTRIIPGAGATPHDTTAGGGMRAGGGVAPGENVAASSIRSAAGPTIGQVIDLPHGQASAARPAIAQQQVMPPATKATAQVATEVAGAASKASDGSKTDRRPMATMPGSPQNEDTPPMQLDKAASNDDGPSTAGTMPPRRFSWRHLLLILAVAFVLGVGIAWGAIAVGARIVDYWPHGFGLYAMLVGGGVTMMLTAGLMTAVFYSDSSGHDAAVHHFEPDKPRRTSLRQ